jgi:hypothetical protein
VKAEGALRRQAAAAPARRKWRLHPSLPIRLFRLMREENVTRYAVCEPKQRRPCMRRRKIRTEKKIMHKRSFEKTNPICGRHDDNNGAHAKPQSRRDSNASYDMKNKPCRSSRLCGFARDLFRERRFEKTNPMCCNVLRRSIVRHHISACPRLRSGSGLSELSDGRLDSRCRIVRRTRRTLGTDGQ